MLTYFAIPQTWSGLILATKIYSMGFILVCKLHLTSLSDNLRLIIGVYVFPGADGDSA